MITTRFANANDQAETTIERLCDLINEVYGVAESGMWKPSARRVYKTEVENLIKEALLILAEINGEIVGSIKYQIINDTTSEFGILVADKDYRGKGIGTALVDAAEQQARSDNSKNMRLELLTPRHWQHPSKEFLKGWYSRLGYKPSFSEPFEKTNPEKIDMLATECDFTVWLKEL